MENVAKKNAVIQTNLNWHKEKLLKVLRQANGTGIDEERAWTSLQWVGGMYAVFEARKINHDSELVRLRKVEKIANQLLALIGKPDSPTWSEIRHALWENQIMWFAERNEFRADQELSEDLPKHEQIESHLNQTVKLIEEFGQLTASMKRDARRPAGTSVCPRDILIMLADIFEHHTLMRARPGKKLWFRRFVSEFLAAARGKSLGDETLDKILRLSFRKITEPNFG